MKRALTWLLVLALLAAALPAAAEETRVPGLFDLYLPGWAGDQWVASAVPLADGVLLTSWALLPEDRSRLVASDGVNRWAVQVAVPDEEGMTAVVLYDYDSEKDMPRFSAYPFMADGAGVSAASCAVETRDSSGRNGKNAVLDAAPCEWLGYGCHLLTLAEPAPLGSPVLTEDGELAGIVVAGYGEGPNRMLALTAEEIGQVFHQAAEKLSAIPEWSDPPEGITVRLDGNTAEIDWSGMKLPEKAEGETFYLIMADAGNDYLNYYPAEAWGRRVQYLLTPGRVYLAGVAAFRDTPDELPQQFMTFVPEPAEWLTKYSFTPKVTAIAEMPKAAMAGTAPVPAAEVTEELLRSGRAYFYSCSSYRVDSNLADEEATQTLLVTLTDPDGNNYRYESRWYYDPSLMDDDTWYFSLQQSGLTTFLDRDGYPAGVYLLAWYIGGELADAVTFELK